MCWEWRKKSVSISTRSNSVERVDSAFEAKREAVRPHSRVSVDHFQLYCIERDFKAELLGGLGLGL